MTCEELILDSEAGWCECGEPAANTVYFRRVPPKQVCPLHFERHMAREAEKRAMNDFKTYINKQPIEIRPYIPGENMSGITVAQEDLKAGSPKLGDMIARNPKRRTIQWLIPEASFTTYERVGE